MKFKFSIATLLLLTLISALLIRAWQESQPLDHFQLAVTGVLAEKLPPNTTLRILRNPDYRRNVECELALSALPSVLNVDFSRTGCVVEFWAPNHSGLDQCLFSIVVDRDLFDTFRIITLKLDKPNPELRPDLDFWATQAWSPRITQRMRYRELPWMDESTQLLAPIPGWPEMIVSRKRDGEILERCLLKKHQCLLNYYFADFAEHHVPQIEDGEEILFSVTYDSGLFDPISSEYQFRYNEKKNKFW